MISISTSDDLTDFRAAWGGPKILGLLRAHGGRLLVNWPVGVGKSRSIDDVLEAAVQEGVYDLLVVLSPTWQLIEERRWVVEPPKDVRVVVLRPRPSKRCGRHRDEEWKRFETRGAGALARKDICGECPRRRGCDWHSQYGEFLRGARVIFATQSHLDRDPAFVRRLQGWTKAKKVLVILDEERVVLTCFRRRISAKSLAMFVGALAELKCENPTLELWRRVCSALKIQRASADLRCSDWKLPMLPPALAVEVQRTGFNLFHDAFRFIGYEISQFCRSPFASRELHPNGDVTFAAPPRIGTDLLIYSGTAIPEFCEFRLGVKLASPFSDVRFNHPDTRWYNLASAIGMRRYFSGNSDQILDFFAGLVAMRMREGRRPLLVSKKCFAADCAAGMTRRLKALGVKAHVVTGKWTEHQLQDPAVIPLITYGIVGVNLFEDFDTAYCLNSFYVSPEVLDSVVQDVLATDNYIPLRTHTGGVPLRRWVTVVNNSDGFCDVSTLANFALRQQELDVVTQAVGRVRPFTKPREVFTFQAAENPSRPYDREFLSLDEARRFFKIPAERQRRAETTSDKVQDAKAVGMSQAEVAKALRCSLRTVKRRWRAGATKP